MAPTPRRKAAAAASDETNGAGETKEEAKKRRALQKEKRQLAAKREEERLKKTRKRKAVDDEEEEKELEDDVKTSGKKVRVAKKAPTPSSTSTRKSSRVSAKKPDPEPQNDEEDKKDEAKEPEKEEAEDEKPAAKPPKPASTRKKPPAKATAARKTQKSKHSRPTPRAAAHTPPRKTESKRAGSASKPPFGSPKPAPAPSPVDPPLAAAAPPVPMDPPQAAAPAAAAPVAAPPVEEDAKIPAVPSDPPTTTTTSTIAAPTMAAAAAAASAPADPGTIPLPGSAFQHYDDDDDDSDDDDFDDSDDDDDDDDHNSLRQQALRVIAERRDREYVARMQAQAAAIAREQAKMERERKEAENKRKRWTTPLYWLFMTMMGSYILSRIFPNGLDLFEMLFPAHFPKKQFCFRDSERATLDEPPAHPVPNCEQKPPDFVDTDGRKVNIIWQACPTGASCVGGELVSCPRLYAIHDNYCYLSEESNKTLAEIHELLEEWSADAYCTVQDDANYDIFTWAGRPFFHYSRVVGELECGYDPSLLFLGNQTLLKNDKEVPLFLLDQNEKDLWLALHPQVPVKIPMTCRTFLAVMYVLFGVMAALGFVATYVWEVAKYLSYMYVGAFMASPAYVVGSTLVVSGISFYLYRNWQQWKDKEERESEVLKVRGMVLQHLEEASNEGKALDAERLKSDIIWKVHEMSRSGRRNLSKVIWPHVAGDINEDDRVHKAVRTENGKRVTYWKWVAPSAPTSPSYGQRQRMVRFDQ